MVNLCTNLKSIAPPTTMMGKNAKYRIRGVVWGSQGSLKVTANSTIPHSKYKYLLAFHCHYVYILHHSGDIVRYFLCVPLINILAELVLW